MLETASFFFSGSFHRPLRLLAAAVLARDFVGTYRKLCQSIISILGSVAPLHRRIRQIALDIRSATLRSDPSFTKSTDSFEFLRKLLIL
jgi:hypothetical protein